MEKTGKPSVQILMTSTKYCVLKVSLQALSQRAGFLQKKYGIWIGEFLTPALEGIAFMCRKALKQGLLVKYDVKASNRYQKVVIKETKHTIWSREQLKDVLLAETPEKKIEIEQLYSSCTKK